MGQRLLENPKLLDKKGNLFECGYHTYPIKEYKRKDIRVSSLRIKEWDYYYVGNARFGVAFTIADNGYMSLVSASFFDFDGKQYIERSKMGFMSKGRLNLPSSPIEGDSIYKKDGIELYFIHEGPNYRIVVNWPDFLKKRGDLRADLSLEKNSDNYMVIATPFKKRRHFYYNVKHNPLLCKGKVSLGDDQFDFENSFGVLDWGRGVWTYRNTWYWSSASGLDEQGTPIGFNLGYGFGDTSSASENMFFLGKKAYKLDDVDFGIPGNGENKPRYMENWHFTSKSGDIELTFTPVLYRHNHSSALVISSDQNQVFGKFDGTIILKEESGETITKRIKDLYGFAEKVKNRW